MRNLVSILIPAYNAEKWVADTIRSAINQTWPNTEIIIVDDGSTDNTLAIAKTFESATVKVISQENTGSAEARNRALSYAQGDYIQYLDADDLLSADKIAIQMKKAEGGADSKVLLSGAMAKFFFRYKNKRGILLS